MPSLSALLTALVLGAVVISLLAVHRLHGSDWLGHLRARFLLGVPWGTMIVMLFVLGVYLFVQDGLTNFDRPIVIPYRAWSYLYPFGVIVSGYAHAGPGHLTSNLVATAVVGPIAEYAWGHYPPEGEDGESEDRPWHNPTVRAFLIFPGVVLGLALLTAAFALGHVIGFSGIVFALGGFALVRLPITTLVGAIGVQGVVWRVYGAVQNPVIEATAEPRPPAPPSWAEIAIQGHAIGLLIGLLIGIAVFHRRGFRPNPFRFWVALLTYGFAKALWAVYWFRGEGVYVLFQGPGVVIVAGMALLVTIAVTGPERPLGEGLREVPGRIREHWRSLRNGGNRRDVAPSDATAGADAPVEFDPPPQRRPPEDRSTDGPAPRHSSAHDDGGLLAPARRPTVRFSAVLALILVLGLVAGPAIPANLFVVEDDAAPEEGTVAVDGYVVFYGENVRNEFIGFVDVGVLGETTNVTTSGVIVASPERNIWTPAVTKDRLAFDGQRTIDLGGPGWRTAITAERSGWEPTGNETVYQVWLDPADGDARLAFTSPDRQVDARIDDRAVTVGTANETFQLLVTEGADGDVLGTTEIPEHNETATAGGLTFQNEDGTVFAERGETRVAVAEREEYG